MTENTNPRVRLKRVEPGSYLVPDTDLLILEHYADWAVYDSEALHPLVRCRTLGECRDALPALLASHGRRENT